MENRIRMAIGIKWRKQNSSNLKSHFLLQYLSPLSELNHQLPPPRLGLLTPPPLLPPEEEPLLLPEDDEDELGV